MAWDKLNTSVGMCIDVTASSKLRKAKHTLNAIMKQWGSPADKGDWVTTNRGNGYVLNASCVWKVG